MFLVKYFVEKGYEISVTLYIINSEVETSLTTSSMYL